MLCFTIDLLVQKEGAWSDDETACKHQTDDRAKMKFGSEAPLFWLKPTVFRSYSYLWTSFGRGRCVGKQLLMILSISIFFYPALH